MCELCMCKLLGGIWTWGMQGAAGAPRRRRGYSGYVLVNAVLFIFSRPCLFYRAETKFIRIYATRVCHPTMSLFQSTVPTFERLNFCLLLRTLLRRQGERVSGHCTYYLAWWRLLLSYSAYRWLWGHWVYVYTFAIGNNDIFGGLEPNLTHYHPAMPFGNKTI